MTNRSNSADDGLRTLRPTLLLALILLTCTGAMSKKYVNGFCAPGKRPCILKCCDSVKWYGPFDRCVKPNAPLSNNFKVPKLVNQNGTQGVYEEDHFHLSFGKMKCVNLNQLGTVLLNPLEDRNAVFLISKHGWLMDTENNTVASPGQFCLEQFTDYKYQILAAVCFDLKIEYFKKVLMGLFH